MSSSSGPAHGCRRRQAPSCERLAAPLWAPSPHSQLRRGEWPSKRTQPLLTAAASSLHKDQGLVQRQERLLQRSCIAHRLRATVNQQLARPVTQSGEERVEPAPQLSTARCARNARRAVYKCNAGAASTFVCRRLDPFLRHTAIAAYLIRCGTCCNGTRTFHSTLHHVPTRAHVGAKARVGAS
jgi:hypothetical protein